MVMNLAFPCLAVSGDIVVTTSVDEYVCVVRAYVVRVSSMVRVINCTFMHGIQNNLAQLLSLRWRSDTETFV